MPLTFKVEGPAEIVGVVNGDMASDEPMIGNRRSLYNGRAAVVLHSKRAKGPVTLTVIPEGDKEIKYEMQTI
ncbi:MAG: hypothetical protein NC411_08795 [Bacteroides sp.]|nr:hypothetical protein [Bacteroides sp.]